METGLFREATFDTGNVVLNYAEGPASGPSLVMLHGGGGRWQLYFDMLAELTKRCHVYAPDLRGHGKSGWVQRALTLLTDPTHKRFPGMDHGLIYDPKGPPMEAVNAFISQLSLK